MLHVVTSGAESMKNHARWTVDQVFSPRQRPIQEEDEEKDPGAALFPKALKILSKTVPAELVQQSGGAEPHLARRAMNVRWTREAREKHARSTHDIPLDTNEMRARHSACTASHGWRPRKRAGVA